MKVGDDVIHKPTGKSGVISYITPYECDNPIEVICEDGGSMGCSRDSLEVIPDISESVAIALYQAVRDEMTAHSVFVNTGADRGGVNGTKGMASQKWMCCREKVKQIMKVIEDA